MARDASQLKVEVVGDASKLNKTLQGVQGRMKNFGASVSRAGGTLTKFVSGPIAGAVGGLGALAKKEGERADALLDAQARTQASLETLQEYKHVADQAGVSEEFFTDATKDMSRQLASAAQGGKRASAAFEDLGINIRDSNGEVRSTSDLTEEAMQKLAGMENESKRAAIAQDLFKSSQQDVLAVVNQGADAIDKQRQKAHELGVVQSEEALKSSNEFRKSVEQLQTKFKGLAVRIGSEVAPLLENKLVPFIENRVLPAVENVVGKIKSAAEWFGNLDPRIQKAIAAATGLVAALGPVLMVVGKVVSVMGSLAPVLSTVAGAISLPVAAIGALVAGLVLAYNKSETFRGIVHDVIDTVKGFAKLIRSTLVGDLHGAHEAFSMIPEPLHDIGEAVHDAASWFRDVLPKAIDTVKEVISAFVEEAKRLWQRWGDDIIKTAESAWDAISAIVTTVVEAVKTHIEWFVAGVKELWSRFGDDIVEFARETWDNVKTMIEGALKVVRGIFETFAGLFTGDWERMWEGIKTMLGGVWQFLEGALEQFLDTLGQLAEAGLEELANLWKRMWGALKDFVSDTISGVVGFVKSLPGRARDALAGAWSAISGFVTRQFSGLKTAAVNRAQEIVDWFRDLPQKIIDAMGDLGGAVGDWVGDQFERIPGVGGGGPEVSGPSGGPQPGEMPGGSVINKLSGYMESTGIPHRVTSTYRPGDSGYHGQGRAVDFAGMRPGWDSPALREIQRAWVPLAASGKLKELIGPIEGLNYKNGRQIQYGRSVEQNHKDHVHTAMVEGGLVKEPVFGVGRSGATYSFGERGPETVTPQRGGAGATSDAIVAELRRQNELLRELAGAGGNQVDITVHNPEAEPAGETVERQLKRVEAVGLFGTSP
jgi:phage-related protein